jgi:transposase
MNYLGIDVSKKELVWHHSSGAYGAMPNRREDIVQFVHDHSTLFSVEETIMGCESTGDYHRTFCEAGLTLGYEVRLLNPLLTKKAINATIRKKKTDRSDAQIIVALLERGEGDRLTLASLHQEKRTILRTEQLLTRQAADLKRMMKSLQEKAKTMMVEEAMEAVRTCLDTLEQQADRLVEEAVSQKTEQEKRIDSVPGCGEKLAAIITAEAGDIKRFRSAKQFKAYVGIDPIVSQSGERLHLGRMSKRGNRVLRWVLYMAAQVASIHDPELNAFYRKKRSEGKSHRHAVCTVLRKLCERIYTITIQECLYVPRNIPERLPC